MDHPGGAGGSGRRLDPGGSGWNPVLHGGILGDAEKAAGDCITWANAQNRRRKMAVTIQQNEEKVLPDQRRAENARLKKIENGV